MTALSPISGNYVVGKGMVFFKVTGSNKWEELGDVDSFSLSQEVERLERFSNQYAVRTQTDARINQQKYTLAATLFQLNRRNRAMGLLADVTDLTQSGGTGPTQVISGIVTGGIYKLDYNNVTMVTLTDGAGQSYTVSTHYELDSEAGLVRIIGKPAAAGSNLAAFYSKAAIVAGDERLNAGIGSSPNLEGSIMFRGVNTVGRAVEVMFWKVRIAPSGEREYISDEYSSIQIEGECLADSTQAANYTIGYERDLNTTT
jgi:hypothetical protein